MRNFVNVVDIKTPHKESRPGSQDFETLNGSNLKIGDVVIQLNQDGTPANGLFNELVVINKTPETVEFYRVYISLADFTYTGGVIPYIGTTRFETPLPHPMEYKLLGNIYHGKD